VRYSVGWRRPFGASRAMFCRDTKAGSLYWLGLRDGTGAYLDGGKSSKPNVPLEVPGKLFWSVTVYDAATRSRFRPTRKRRRCGGWFAYFRIYGPEQAAFDGSWKPGDFEAVK
jgi:hypothetical protein